MADASSTNTDDFLGAKQQAPWRQWLKWGGGAIVVLLVLWFAWSWFKGAEPVAYSTDTVDRGNLTVTVSATGKLAPTNQVTVGSQLSGLVTKVLVDVNDRVTAGQPLALIDPEQIDDQIRQGEAGIAANEAQVAQAQASLAEANAQMARFQEVFRASGGRVPAKAEMDTARANQQRAVAALRVAQANVAQSRAQLSQSRTQRQRAVIVSPVTGVVLARQVDPGQTVAASFNTPTLFVIAEDLSQMKLEVAIDEADVGEVKVGQKANFTVDAFPGKTFPATITRVDLGSNLTVSAASASSSTSTTSTTGQVVSYAADMTVANPTLELRPGMTATADIVTVEKTGILLVPNAALRFRPQTAEGTDTRSGITGALMRGPRRGSGAERTVTTGRGAQQSVYVQDEKGEPKQVRVITGDTDGSMTEVMGGDLKPGMKVITGQLASGGTATTTRRSGASGSSSGGQSRQGGQQGSGQQNGGQQGGGQRGQ